MNRPFQVKRTFIPFYLFFHTQLIYTPVRSAKPCSEGLSFVLHYNDTPLHLQLSDPRTEVYHCSAHRMKWGGRKPQDSLMHQLRNEEKRSLVETWGSACKPACEVRCTGGCAMYMHFSPKVNHNTPLHLRCIRCKDASTRRNDEVIDLSMGCAANGVEQVQNTRNILFH